MMRSLSLPFGVWVAGALAFGASVAAAAETSGDATPRISLEEAAPIPHHHVGIFAGGATRFTSEEEGETETGVALGMEYEYRFARHWGTGLLAEGILSAHPRDAILVVPLNWHPWEWLKLSAAPGVEFVTDGPEQFVMRLGAAYEFELGAFNIAPEVSVDLSRNAQTLVYGLSVGRRF
ncbi:MAG: hypothetical protein JNL10_10555 [Verrucomicrobiales bacterium]|nr:hypothetical protein [Verrucomicrobiales bacterium]